jgi:hypothetical protein
MKRAWVYAVSAVVVVTAGVWLLPHAPSTEEPAAPEATALSPLDAKVQEAVAIIESGEGNPMQAIFALREVVEEDSTHRDAQFIWDNSRCYPANLTRRWSVSKSYFSTMKTTFGRL